MVALKASRLAAELDQVDEDSEVYVYILGHRMRIKYVEPQVGFTEIVLEDEHTCPDIYLRSF